MKKHFKPLLFMTLCFFMLPIQVSAKTETIEQAEPISYVTITNGKVNKKVVKSGDTLKYQFTINDEGISEHDEAGYFGFYLDDNYYPASLCYVCITWEAPKNQIIERSYKWNREKKKSLTISDKIKVMDGMQSGKWKLARIQIVDGLGDDEGGGVININDFNDLSDYADCYADLSFAGFNVKKKKGTRVDKKAPTIDLNSLKVSKAYVKTNEKVTFSVKVKDSSKIEYVEAGWRSYLGKDGKEAGYLNDYKMKYNKKKKCCQCTVSLADDEIQKLLLEGIYVKDIYGNATVYSVDVNGKQIEYYTSKLKWKKYGKASDFSKVTIHRK